MGIRPTTATLISRRLAPMQGSTWGHRMHPAAMTSPACHRYVRVDEPFSVRSRLGVELCDDLGATLRSMALYSTFIVDVSCLVDTAYLMFCVFCSVRREQRAEASSERSSRTSSRKGPARW